MGERKLVISGSVAGAAPRAARSGTLTEASRREQVGRILASPWSAQWKEAAIDATLAGAIVHVPDGPSANTGGHPRMPALPIGRPPHAQAAPSTRPPSATAMPPLTIAIGSTAPGLKVSASRRHGADGHWHMPSIPIGRAER